MFKLVIISIAACLLLTACPPPNVELSPAGMKVPMISSDLAQALPGRPLDRCTIKAHIGTEESFFCLSTSDLDSTIRNKAADAGGNCIIVTSYIYRDCQMGAKAVRGIAISCAEDVLKAAALK